MAISEAYNFLTRAFGAHQNKALADDLKSAGSVVSKKEGAKLGINADTFADFYATHRQPGKSVRRGRFQKYATAHIAAQMKALRTSLEAGPGVDGFQLAEDVVDNWQSFIASDDLFKYADLPDAHKAAVMQNAYWDFDEIPVAPSSDSVARTQLDDAATLPEAVRSYIAGVESRYYVSADPAETPPTESDLTQLTFKYANEVKVDDVVVGYVVRFNNGGYTGVPLNVDGTQVHNGLGLHEVTPDDAVGFADLTARQKIDALRAGDFDSAGGATWSSKSVPEVLTAMGSTIAAATVKSEVEGALDFVADTIDNDIYYMANVSLHGMGITIDRAFLAQFDSYDALVAHIVARAEEVHGAETAEEIADALGNGGADVSQPDIEVYQEDGEMIGATFRWSVSIDGDHDYWTELVYDHTTNTFVGGATGGYETDTDVWVNGE